MCTVHAYVSLFMYVRVCIVCMYVQVQVCVCACYVCAYVTINMCMCVYRHLFVCVCVCVYLPLSVSLCHSMHKFTSCYIHNKNLQVHVVDVTEEVSNIINRGYFVIELWGHHGSSFLDQACDDRYVC